MNTAEQIELLNIKLDRLLEVVFAFPGMINKASVERNSDELTKDDIECMLIDSWNKKHPLYQIKKKKNV